MQQVCPKESCTGCTACMNVCAHSAISMKADKYGFYYPEIDQNKCVDCGLCVKTCPVNHPVHIEYPSDCYAVVCKDREELKKVASGGMASIFSKYVLDRNGVVYGANGIDIRNVHHTRVDRLEALDSIRGSKYVQSYMGDIYKQVKKDLKEGKQVLFTGTPCQVAGLKAFLHNKVYDNLITADLVCHGVPSQQMLNDNIDTYHFDKNEKLNVAFRIKPIQLEQPNDSKGIDFGFNIKPRGITYCFFLGGASAAERYQWEIKKSINDDAYMLGFWRCLTFRPNCFDCRYACAARCGDFTIADFWGLGDDTGLDKSNGVSLLLVNSDKAKEVWKEVSKDCISVKRSIVEAIKGNDQLQRPSKKPADQPLFRKLYPEMSFHDAVYTCSKGYLKNIKKQRIKNVIRRIIHLRFLKK